MSRSCHSATFSSAGRHRHADEAGETGEVLAEDRVALVRHRRAALLADVERLLGLEHLGALEVTDLHRQPLDRGGDHRQGGEIGGVAVAGDDLGGDGLDAQAHLFGDVRLHTRVDAGEGADRPGDGAGGDLESRHRQPLPRADEFGVVAGELEAECGRLGVDAVAAAHRRRHLVLEGAALEGGEDEFDILHQQVGGAAELDGEGGVVDVRRGHALVQESRLRPHDLGDVGQEGDDVVFGLALDLVDAVDIEDHVAAALPDRLGGELRDDAQFRHGVGGVGLDLEHDLETGLRRPDRGGLGSGVAGDHEGGLAA